MRQEIKAGAGVEKAKEYGEGKSRSFPPPVQKVSGLPRRLLPLPLPGEVGEMMAINETKEKEENM